MSNKKFSKLAVLSFLGVLALTGCSQEEIISKPKNYDDPIITIDGETEKIQNNINSIIADQLQKGDLPSKTLDKVLYRYAQSIFGSYNRITLGDGDVSTTLKEAYTIVYNWGDVPDEDREIVFNFIRAHKVYWNYNEKSEHVDDSGNKVEDDKTFVPCETEIINVKSRYEDIEKRIAENMYSKATTGGYTEKHFFKEYEFVKSLYDAGQSVIHYSKVKADTSIKPLIIDYAIEEEDVFNEGILHRDFYQTGWEFYADEREEIDGESFHYIEKEIIPQIYNDLLVEQYLLDEESNAVKQSRARLINVIKIEKYSSFTINADLLVRQLVKEIYSRKPAGEYYDLIKEENNPYEAIFEKYEDISKGLTVVDTSVDYSALKKTNPDDPDYWNADQIIYRIHDSRSDAFKYGKKQGIEYYENTTYGDLVEDYDEFLTAESFDDIDTSLRNKFTSSGTVSPEEGFDQEKIALSQVETITKGWYVQKSAPTLDADGKIKNNLFQISVANNKLEAKTRDSDVLKFDNYNGLAAFDRYEKANASAPWTLRSERSGEENKYICSINGAYFLKFEGKPSTSDYIDDIVCEDANAYYIVQVVEAAKDVKLRNAESANSYANTREEGFLNKVISEVTTKVAGTGSYSTLSKEYWLKKMDIKYHDQKVYDYFKSNYPDLFED